MEDEPAHQPTPEDRTEMAEAFDDGSDWRDELDAHAAKHPEQAHATQG